MQAVDAFGTAPVFRNHAKRSEAGAKSAPRARLRFAEIINPPDKEDEVPIMAENAAITLEFDYHEVGKPKGCRTWRWRENVGSVEASIPVADEPEAPVAFRFDDPRSGEPVELRVFDGRIWRCMDVAFGGAGSVYRGDFREALSKVLPGRREGFEPVPWSKDLPGCGGPRDLYREKDYDHQHAAALRWERAHMACCGLLWQQAAEPRYRVDGSTGLMRVQVAKPGEKVYGYSAAERTQAVKHARKAFAREIGLRFEQNDDAGRATARELFEAQIGSCRIEVARAEAAADPTFAELAEVRGLAAMARETSVMLQPRSYDADSAFSSAAAREVVEGYERLAGLASRLAAARTAEIAARQSRTGKPLSGEDLEKAVEALAARI